MDSGDLDLILACSACLNYLRNKGYEVDLPSGIENSFDLVTNVKMGNPLTPVISPSHNDFLEGQINWLILKKGGEAAACVAAKVEDFGSESPSDFIKRSLNRQYHQEIEGDAVGHVESNDLLGLGRRVAYIGGLEVSDEYKGNGKAVIALMGLLQCICALLLRVDHTYAFVSEADGGRKVASHYGFNTSICKVVHWQNVPEGRYEREYFLRSSISDIKHNARDLITTLSHGNSS